MEINIQYSAHPELNTSAETLNDLESGDCLYVCILGVKMNILPVATTADVTEGSRFWFVGIKMMLHHLGR